MAKLTPWFPPTIKPVRVGVYLTGLEPYKRSELNYAIKSYWCGAHWIFLTHIKTGLPHRIQDRFWRGLTKEQAK